MTVSFSSLWARLAPKAEASPSASQESWLQTAAMSLFRSLFSTLAGFVLQTTLPNRRRQARTHTSHLQNIGLLNGQPNTILRLCFRFHGRYYFQLAFPERCRATGVEELDDPRGALILTAHVGPWDSAGRYLAARFPERLGVIVRYVRPMWVNCRLNALRRSFGLQLFYRDVTDTDECREFINQGNILVVFADRDYSASGPPVTLFGMRTTVDRLFADLVREVSPDRIFIAATSYGPNDATVRLERFTQTPDSAQAVAEAAERVIRCAPNQWHMFSPHWTKSLAH